MIGRLNSASAATTDRQKVARPLTSTHQEKVISMWIRTIKVTFANELMKKSVRSYFSDHIDASLGQLVTYSVDLAENVVLVTHIFPDQHTLNAFEKTMKPQRDQLKSMGTKVEINDGPVWSFKVAGDITLDTLTKGVSPR